MKKKKIVCCLTNNVMYDSITDAAKAAGIEGWKLSQALQRKDTATYNGMTFTKNTPTRRQLHMRKMQALHRKVVICNETGKRFVSLSEFSKFVKAHPAWISASIRKTGEFKRNGFTYSYEKPINVSTVAVKAVKKPTITAKVDNVSTNEQTDLQKTLISFINKGMYTEASALCDTMQKIYAKK